jgi:cell division protein FtsW (lipid II flippase)
MSGFFYMGVGVAHEEKRAWIMLVVTVAAYAAYLVAILGQAAATPLDEVPYVPAMLWTIGAAIAASIVLSIAVAIASPEDANKKDDRDREINRLGEHIGQSFVVIGGVAAMAMAMAELDHFWIANAIYLGFALSAVLGSVAKIFAYRRGFQSW